MKNYPYSHNVDAYFTINRSIKSNCILIVLGYVK